MAESVKGWDLDQVLGAYLDAILFAETDNATEQGGEPLDRNYGREDFTDKATVSLREDCRKFLLAVPEKDLAEYARSSPTGTSGDGNRYTPEEYLGHDLWLTSQGHGAGFWDRTWLPDDLGERLTDLSKTLVGERSVYISDDGEIEVDNY